MNRKIVPIALLAAWLPAFGAHADPIHRIADGAYWHHDSGWVFPENIGGFGRIGIPQDVAGGSDAIAYYAWVVNGARVTASVEVYPQSSATSASLDAANRLSSQSTLVVGNALPAVRRVYETQPGEAAGVTAVYIVTAGDWGVRIRISAAPTDLAAMDAFVFGQRWDTLGAH